MITFGPNSGAKGNGCPGRSESVSSPPGPRGTIPFGSSGDNSVSGFSGNDGGISVSGGKKPSSIPGRASGVNGTSSSGPSSESCSGSEKKICVTALMVGGIVGRTYAQSEV